MREIKFRAWNKLAHKMAIVDMLDFMLDSYRAHAGKFSGSGHLADIELMQYTGLHDRSGKEIYESDIVMWNIYPEDKDTITVIDVVEFSRGLFATKARHQILATIEPHRKLEVIGNMYENPKLLSMEQTT
jgi:uncharacterized phage protein (TIGR01671 family)